MKSQRRWPGIAIAVITAAVIIAAYGDTRESAAESAEPAIAAEAAAVEARLANTGLLEKLQEALGDTFGGLWFDQSTAQLHVGISSPEIAKAAAAVAAEARMAAHVTPTPVRSTWDELLSAQEEWGERTADLFDRAEVSTAVRAELNAVEVQLGSAVPSSRRAELERAAEASSTNVLITVAKVPQIRIENQAKTCRAFAAGKANCDPTITAGITIENEAGLICTGGPVVLPNAHVATDSYILTSGHCIDKAEGGEGVGKKWYAYPKKAVVKGERVEIGQAVEFINNTAADIGVIKVEHASWMNKGFTPIEPAVALWPLPAEESEPKVITGQQNVVAVGLKSCVSGQTSGKACGEIVKFPVHVTGNEELVEVKTATKAGDSGGPWYTEANPSIILGTHDGENVATGRAVFEPLITSFKNLELKGLKLKLLIEANKNRQHC